MDDKNKKGGSDRIRIDVNQDYEVQDWSDKLGLSADELKRAVEAVGTFADDVDLSVKL